MYNTKKKVYQINKDATNNAKSILKTWAWRKMYKEQNVVLWWLLYKFLVIKNELEAKNVMIFNSTKSIDQ